MWESDTSAGDDGVDLSSDCVDNARCADIIRGDGGSAPEVFAMDGARYYARARFAAADNGAWMPWSTYDWFEMAPMAITLSVDSGTFDLPAHAPGTNVVGTSVVTVDSNAQEGYVLSANDEADAWAMDLDDAGVVTIADWEATDGNPNTADPPNEWHASIAGFFGVTVLDVTGILDDRLPKWGNANSSGWPAGDFINNHFAGLNLNQSMVLHQTATHDGGDDTVTVGYRLKADPAQTPGNYNGTITYTATAAP